MRLISSNFAGQFDSVTHPKLSYSLFGVWLAKYLSAGSSSDYRDLSLNWSPCLPVSATWNRLAGFPSLYLEWWRNQAVRAPCWSCRAKAKLYPRLDTWLIGRYRETFRCFKENSAKSIGSPVSSDYSGRVSLSKLIEKLLKIIILWRYVFGAVTGGYSRSRWNWTFIEAIGFRYRRWKIMYC